jgi:ubiquinone/menaquinone biosynthesis C-methylase UbiE
MARDIYSRLADVDDDMLRTIASALEIRGSHPQQVAIRAAILDGLGDLSGQRVLDVGCGTGVATRDFARRVGANGSVVGTDPTPTFVEIAERHRNEQRLANATFQIADGRSQSFPDASFDVVAAITVLSHVPERAEIVREMMRLCKPGGTILIVDGDFASHQLEHPDRELAAQIVEAWRATTVDDPRLMRRLGPFLAEAGLTIDPIKAYVHVEAGTVDTETSFVWAWAMFAVRQSLNAGVISEAQAARWTEQLREHNERGLLYGAFTFVSATARRP